MSGIQMLLVGLLFVGILLLFAVLTRNKQQQRLGTNPTRRTLTGLEKPAEPTPDRNGKPREVMQLASSLVSFARGHGMQVVYPAVFRFEDKLSGFPILLVGPFGVLAVKPYGHGGRVEPAPDGHGWQQTLNGNKRSLPDPVAALNEDTQLLVRALAAGGYDKIGIEAAVVFTHKPLTLAAPSSLPVYTADAFSEHLRKSSRLAADYGVDPKAVSAYLTDLVKKTAAEEKAKVEADKESAKQK